MGNSVVSLAGDQVLAIAAQRHAGDAGGMLHGVEFLAAGRLPPNRLGSAGDDVLGDVSQLGLRWTR